MKKVITLLFFIGLYHVDFAQWAEQKGIPVERAGTSSFSIGDTGYVVLGGGSRGYLADAWKYNKATNTWTSIAAPPSPNEEDNSPVGFAIGDAGYVGTGCGPGYQFSNQFWKYDTRLNNWTPIANFPGVSRCGAVAFVINGKGYVGGGFNGFYNPENDFYAYDPSTGQWSSALAQCPAQGVFVNAVAFAANGKGYVGTGGNFSAGSTTWIPQSDFWAYDPIADAWTAVASMPCGPRMGGVAFAINNIGYVGTGVSDAQQQNLLKDFWKFDPSNGPSGTWTRIEDYAAGGRESATAFVIGNEGYVCAGWPPNGMSTSDTSLWSYTPDGVVMGGGGGPLDIEPKSFSVCPGQLVALTVVGDSGIGANLVWTPSTGLNQAIGDTVLATINSDIVYTVTSGSGCVTSSATDTITLKASNPLTFTPSNPTACPGVDVAIAVSGGSNFTWNPSAGVVPSGDSLIASLGQGVDSTVYTVIGLNLLGCPDTGTVTLRSGGLVDAGHVTAVRDTICGGTPGNLSWIGNAGNNLQWQSSPDDITYSTISGATSTSYKTTPLQQSTWYHVLVGAGNCSATSDSLELIVPPALTAYFNLKQGSNNNELVFNSDSSIGNIRSYHWDFGDGGTSTDSNPSHTFAKDTIYYVCLTLYDGSNCSYTFCRYSQVISGVPTISAAGNWIIYPNPFSEQLTVSSKQGNSRLQSIEMYDVLGQLVINRNVGNTTNTSIQLDVSSLAKGMYYVMIKTADADYVQKVVKQ